MTGRQLIKLAERKGWYKCSSANGGGHVQYQHKNGARLTLLSNTKSLPPGTYHKLLKAINQYE